MTTIEQTATLDAFPPSPTPTLSRSGDGARADLATTSSGLPSTTASTLQRRPSGQVQNQQVPTQPLTPLTTSQVNQPSLGRSPAKVLPVAPSPDMARSPAPQNSGESRIKLENNNDAAKHGPGAPNSNTSPPPAEASASQNQPNAPEKAELTEQTIASNQTNSPSDVMTQGDHSQHLSSPPSTVPGEGLSDTEAKQSESRQTSPRQGLGILLGSSFNDFPVNNDTLAEALRFKAEQERTKQEFYRLEHRKRSLDLLNTAIRAGISSNSLALLFGTPEEIRQLEQQPPPTQTVSAGPSSTAAAAPATTSTIKIVNYEDHNRSPARYRTHMQRASTSSVPSFGGARSGNPPIGVMTSPTNIQFHHWRPNQTRERSNSSPKRETEKRKSYIADSGANASPAAARTTPQEQRARPPQPHLEQSVARNAAPPIPSPRSPLRQTPTTVAAGSNIPASVVAAQNSRRRTMGHSRHRSEAAINRHSWYATGRHDEGAAILANMASERSKHDMDYILDHNRGGWQQQASVPVPMGQPGGIHQTGVVPFPMIQQQQQSAHQSPPVQMASLNQPQAPTATMPPGAPMQPQVQPGLLPAPQLRQVNVPAPVVAVTQGQTSGPGPIQPTQPGQMAPEPHQAGQF
ncbi:hypothetical protein B9G98_00144 [Wickerhamiella sorbophila]|uniref:Uncharacterized protein n=1 Tax=Wickerhamiella sorbophila TaxID=45607 RepID=A0A2T0FBY5_9ASCO|nr:hypothetical protein B9G98_00144 [Wickerhamiella sorbophila]PRT52524.1 hypothetical protein B9G98_00144 [Wickerhamiella sorbophila]